MMFLAKVLVVLVGTLFQASYALGAPEEPRKDYESVMASQKGLELLGTILHSSPYEHSNIALIKILASNKTVAKQVGSALVLDESYTITSVDANYLELQGARKKIRLYKYGFVPPTQIKAVEKKKISISGKFSEPGFEREDGNIKITEEYRKHMLEKDLPKILMQAAAEPKLDSNGNILGFALFDIEKDSIYAKAGLVDGDVIKSINGEELNSAQGTVKLLNSLKSANGVNFTIERGGQSIPLNLDVQ